MSDGSLTPIHHQRRFVGYTAAKVPIDPKTGRSASVSDPRSWGTLAEAEAWAVRNGGHVGFIPLDDLLVIDFDGAVRDGVIDPWVMEWIRDIGGETEISVSGTGIHICVPTDERLRQLLPHKRQIRSAELSIAGVDLITGHNGVILGTRDRPAHRSLAEQQAAAARLIEEIDRLELAPTPMRRSSKNKRLSIPERVHHRILRTGHVLADLNLANAAYAHGADSAYAGYLFVKTLIPDGRGYGYEDVLVRQLGPHFPGSRKHPKKAARNLLKRLAACGFADRERCEKTGRWVISLRSPGRIAQVLGTTLGERVTIPLEACLTRKHRQWLYLGGIEKRDGTPDRPRPTSRKVRREMTGVSANTQRKAEKEAGVRVEENYAVGSPPPGRPWRRLADGRIVYRISNSTQVRHHVDRQGLDERMVHPHGQRTYYYPDLHAAQAGISGYLYRGRHALDTGELVHLWERI